MGEFEWGWRFNEDSKQVLEIPDEIHCGSDGWKSTGLPPTERMMGTRRTSSRCTAHESTLVSQCISDNGQEKHRNQANQIILIYLAVYEGNELPSFE